jgi:hypothetical protein
MSLENGLIAKYVLDTNANDSVGSNNGTLVGSPTFATGEGRTALDVNGTSQYASIPYSADLVPANITVSTWVKFDVIDDTYDAVVWQNGPDASNALSYCFTRYRSGLVSDPNKIKFIIVTTNEGKGLFSDQPAEANRWYHLVGTYDGTTAKFYVDGILNTSEALTGDVKQYPGSSLDFGRNSIWSNENLNGKVDDTRIWNRALSASEVTELHAEALALGLVASSMEEGGTLTGAAQLVSDGDRTQVLSLVGNSTSDYVQHASPYNHNNITISAWVKPSSTITGNAYIAGTEAGGGANNGYTLSTVGMQVGNWAGNAGSWSGFNAGSNLVVGEWAHLVNVIADGQQAMYINGALVHSQAMTIANPVSTVNFRIGNYPLATPSRPFPGQIDDVRLWSRGLSASEVATLHSTTAATSDALVKHLKFDGNDTGMTLSGGASVTNVDGRSALALDGTGDYLTLPGSSDFDFGTADFTLGFWMKPTNTTQWAALMSSPNYWTSGYSGNWGIDIYNYPGIGSKIRLYSYGDGQAPASELAYVSSVVLTTEWQHIVFVRDSGTLKCFINGVESGSTRADNFSTADLSDGVNGLYLGHTAPGSGTDFDGSIDDVRIYNKALTQTEIQSIYDDGNQFITLLGNANVNLPMGTAYNDAGSTAAKADGTDITGSIQTEITRSSAIPLYSESLGENPPTGWTDGVNDRNEYFAFTGTRDDTSENISGFVHGRFGSGNDAEKTINIPGSDGKSVMVKGRYVALQSWDADVAQILIDGALKIDLKMQWSTSASDPIVAGSILAGADYITESYFVSDFTGIEEGGNQGNAYSWLGPEGFFQFAIPHVMSGDSLTLKFANQATDGITDESMAFIIDEIIETSAVVGSVDVNDPSTYTISYSISEASVSRVVTVQDVTAPVVTLIGANPLSLQPGDAYTELGASAVDNNDGDLTGSIVITGAVPIQDPALKAYYSLKVDGSDYFGNHNGTLDGAVMSTGGGKYGGNALEFPSDSDANGIADQDHVMNIAPIHFDQNSAYTVMAWVYDLGYPYIHGPNGELSNNGTPYDQYSNPTDPWTRKAALISSDSAGGTIPFYVDDGKFGFQASGFKRAHKPGTTDENIIVDRQDFFGWHHYAVVVDAAMIGSENAKYYMDGVLVGEILPSRWSTHGGREVDFNRVGNLTSGWFSKSFVGQRMNDLAVSGKAYTDQEILDVYNSVGASGVGFGAAEGSYSITYTVSDLSGNETSVVRTVNVSDVVAAATGYTVEGLLASDKVMLFIEGKVIPESVYNITNGNLEITDVNYPGFAIGGKIQIVKVK